jgi:hypothetical protein
MTALPGRRHGCARWLSHRSAFHSGRLRSRNSRGSGCRLLARWRLCGLGLRRIRQWIALLLADRAGLARLGRAGQQRHLTRDHESARQHGDREAFRISATRTIHIRTPSSRALARTSILKVVFCRDLRIGKRFLYRIEDRHKRRNAGHFEKHSIDARTRDE